MRLKKWFFGGLIFLSVPLMASASARATNVVVFDDPAYVDSSGGSGAESDNMQAAIASLGHTVTTITGITATDFSNGLTGQDVLVFPEFEEGDPTPDLTPEAIAVIRDFVASGGRVVQCSSDGEESLTGFFPAVYGFDATETNDIDVTTNKTPAAAGTVFENGPDQLSYNDGSAALLLASLPSGAASIYDDGTNTYVAIIPVGSGQVFFLGYDWFDSNPPNVDGQDNGWFGILTQALADADLSVTKTASPTTVDMGDEVTFTVTATNNGPSDAINAVVTDMLPVGFTLVSATISQGTCSGTDTITCQVGVLANGASATLTIVGTADIEVESGEQADLVNQAEISGVMIDPNTDDNFAEATVTVVNPTPPTPPFPNISGAGCSMVPQSTAPQGITLVALLSLAGLAFALRSKARD